MTASRLILVLSLLLAGCKTAVVPITRAPADWSDSAGKTVTVLGTAGNSPRGPIVRLLDGGYIALKQREPWGLVDGFALAARNVEVTGKLMSGAGIRDEKFVLDVTAVRLMGPDEIKRTAGQSAEP